MSSTAERKSASEGKCQYTAEGATPQARAIGRSDGTATAWGSAIMAIAAAASSERRSRLSALVQQAVGAMALRLSDEEAAALEAPYVNAGPSWF